MVNSTPLNAGMWLDSGRQATYNRFYSRKPVLFKKTGFIQESRFYSSGAPE